MTRSRTRSPSAWADARSAAPVVDALLSMGQVFDEELAADSAWRALLIDHLDALIRDGAERTARRLAA